MHFSGRELAKVGVGDLSPTRDVAKSQDKLSTRDELSEQFSEGSCVRFVADVPGTQCSAFLAWRLPVKMHARRTLCVAVAANR